MCSGVCLVVVSKSVTQLVSANLSPDSHPKHEPSSPSRSPEVSILEVGHQVVAGALPLAVDAHAVEAHDVGMLYTAQHLGFPLIIHAHIFGGR